MGWDVREVQDRRGNRGKELGKGERRARTNVWCSIPNFSVNGIYCRYCGAKVCSYVDDILKFGGVCALTPFNDHGQILRVSVNLVSAHIPNFV